MKRFLVFFSAVFFLISCGTSKDSGTNNTVNLEGTWTGAGCTKNSDSNGSLTEYFREELVFASGVLTYLDKTFGDDKCTTKLYDSSYKASYKTGTDTAGTMTTVADASNIDITVVSSTYTVYSDTLVADHNSKKYCSKSDWKKEVTVDTSSCEAQGFAKGRIFYLIFKATEKELYWGDPDTNNDGSSAAKRAVKISPDPLKRP